MDEMSFAFRVKAQIWSTATGFNDPQSHRLITEVSLHKGDVSVVNFGANPTTAAELLGKRRGRKMKTLTLAEAEAIMRLDTDKPGGAAVSSGSGAAAVRLVQADAAARRLRDAAGDAVMARAREILERSGSARSEQPVVRVLTTRDQLTGAQVMPPLCDLLQVAAEHDRRQRRADAIAELERQRDAVNDSQRSGRRSVRTSRSAAILSHRLV
jgi:hypothetical protein